ncbi:MAG: hypothetical protein HYZ27_01425 [Deltaproteobacteria bacterium]|nr:hypothetical protein [Deltaproteobacteria bacterium]
MQAKTQSEVRDLLGSPAFVAWFERYNELRRSMVEAREHYRDLLVQAAMARFKSDLTTQWADDRVLEAGECEDRAGQAAAEFAEIENSSFEMVSKFEMQRQRATEAWEEMDRSEELLEEQRQGAADLRARADAARKIGSPEGVGEAERIAARLADVETRITLHAKEVEQARARQQLADDLKTRMWSEVEGAWSSAFRANLARTEHAYQGRKVRGEVEELFQRAGGERRRIDDLEREAERTLAQAGAIEADFEQLLAEARRLFECTLVREFLYWPQTDDVRLAWCVPLIDERNHLNIQVRALEIYVVERSRGLDFLEPLPETDRDKREGDPRLERFFREGRPTAPRA